MWLCSKFFLLAFCLTWISRFIDNKYLKFSLCVVYYHIEGTVSQIFILSLSFYFMKSRKLSKKENEQKLIVCFF